MASSPRRSAPEHGADFHQARFRWAATAKVTGSSFSRVEKGLVRRSSYGEMRRVSWSASPATSPPLSPQTSDGQKLPSELRFRSCSEVGFRFAMVTYLQSRLPEKHELFKIDARNWSACADRRSMRKPDLATAIHAEDRAWRRFWLSPYRYPDLAQRGLAGIYRNGRTLVRRK